MIDKRAINVGLMLLAIFVAGGFCGWWIGSRSSEESDLAMARPGRRTPASQKEFMLNEFTRELQLTPEQRTNVNSVLDLWMQESQMATQEHLRSKQTLFERFAPLVRTNLTASQQRTYDRMMAQIERRRRRAAP